MTVAMWLLQQAVYGRLNASTALTSTLGAAVYDHVPAGARMPYVVVGETTAVARDTMGRTGRDVTMQIHVWSEYPGRKQIAEIQARVDTLLDRWAPGVSGWYGTQMLLEYSETMRDPDGVTRHGVQRFRVHVHK